MKNNNYKYIIYIKKMIDLIIDKIKLLSFEDDIGHGINHFIRVYNHGLECIKYEDLNKDQEQAILIACLLHDVDDHKFSNNKNNETAIKIMQECNYDNIELVCQMINLVSCSKNGCSDYDPKWMLIPRDCDRLEAIGAIGIFRAYLYGVYTNRPIYSTTTPAPNNMKDLKLFATEDRFSNYKSNSESLIDHLYDKILHIGLEKNLKSCNKYIKKEAKLRNYETIYIIMHIKEICPTNEDHEELKKYLKEQIL